MVQRPGRPSSAGRYERRGNQFETIELTAHGPVKSPVKKLHGQQILNRQKLATQCHNLPRIEVKFNKSKQEMFTNFLRPNTRVRAYIHNTSYNHDSKFVLSKVPAHTSESGRYLDAAPPL